FQMASVRTSIIGRPRRLSPHRRAHPATDHYTLICEEPSNQSMNSRRTPGDAPRGRDPAPLRAPGRSSCTSNDVVNLVQLARPAARIAPSGEVSGGDAAQPPGERPATPRRRADGPRAKLHRLTRAREAWASSTEF